MSELVGRPRLSTPSVSQIVVTSKVEFFVDVGIWPTRDRLDPYGWLENFVEHERPFALNLLNVFLFYNDALTDALFRSAIQQIGTRAVVGSGSIDDANHEWQAFLRSVRITYVEGEQPNPTDSGYVFARKARQVAGIDESQITHPVNVLAEHASGASHPILLVDDFVGSGRQMEATWHREYTISNSMTASFKTLAENGETIYYVPLVSTEYGMERLAQNCRGLTVSPAHVLDRHYSLVDPDSIMWPEPLRPQAFDFISSASERAGIKDQYGAHWAGFHGLALSLAFAHSVPDATLPLYYWEHNGWKPLVRRR